MLADAALSALLIDAPADVACSLLPAEVAFDAVYLDPPYGVGTSMTARTRLGETRGRKQTASGPAAYMDESSVEALVVMIAKSAVSIRTRMRPHASFFLHLDQRAVHEAKVACDAVFGRGAFAGEIIWVPGNGAKGRGVPMTHQTILVYARSPTNKKQMRWNSDEASLREPYAKTSLSMHFTQRDDAGRLYRERTIAGKTYRYYADKGRKLGSVWSDIPAMRANTPLHAEGTGYPTQKPLALLERIVLASTHRGDTVADLMCGSGTTLVAASRHGRGFVGGDQSPLALETTQRRLGAEAVPFRLITQEDGTGS